MVLRKVEMTQFYEAYTCLSSEMISDACLLVTFPNTCLCSHQELLAYGRLVDTCYASSLFNTLRPRQNGRHFADDIFKCILKWKCLNPENEKSLKFVSTGPINNMAKLVQIMAWRRPGDKRLSEPMMVSLPTHKCVIQPQWVERMTRSVTFQWKSK